MKRRRALDQLPEAQIEGDGPKKEPPVGLIRLEKGRRWAFTSNVARILRDE